MFFKKDREVFLASLGGVGEVGRNCFLYESGNEILVIDCGIMPKNQSENGDSAWQAPIYPLLEILDQKIKEGKRITALITHPHLDHIGAVSELLKRGIIVRLSLKARKFFVARYLNNLISQEELDKANLISFPDSGYAFQFGDFSVECFPVEHSIPGSVAVLIRVGGKSILHLTDFKFNGLTETRHILESKLLQIKKDCGKIDCLAMDVLNAEMPGFTPPEELVIQNIEEIIKTNPGRIFITFFSSNIQRLGEVLKVCRKLGRPVRILGQGMKTSHQEFLDGGGYSRAGKAWLNPFSRANEVIISAGCQGEENSHLWKALQGGWINAEGRFIKSQVTMKRGDTVVDSSRGIPGTEKLKKALFEEIQQRAKRLILQEGESQKLQLPFRAEERFIHVSGHGHQGDILKAIEILDPEKIVPIHATSDKVKILTRLLGADSKKLVELSVGDTFKI